MSCRVGVVRLTVMSIVVVVDCGAKEVAQQLNLLEGQRF